MTVLSSYFPGLLCYCVTDLFNEISFYQQAYCKTRKNGVLFGLQGGKGLADPTRTVAVIFFISLWCHAHACKYIRHINSTVLSHTLKTCNQTHNTIYFLCATDKNINL